LENNTKEKGAVQNASKAVQLVEYSAALLGRYSTLSVITAVRTRQAELIF
jgi:hypothetical protein